MAINMMDIVRKNGDEINTKKLAEKLGCEVVTISALKGDGIKDAASRAVSTPDRKPDRNLCMSSHRKLRTT